MAKQSRFPRGWDEQRTRRVLRHYEAQSEAEARAEDERAFAGRSHTLVRVPIALLPAVRRLIATNTQRASNGKAGFKRTARRRSA